LNFQVEKAEAILKQLKSALDTNDDSKIPKLMSDFHSTLPHDKLHQAVTPTKYWLSRKLDLCQVSFFYQNFHEKKIKRFFFL
jgi:hypothetical protein